MFGNKFKDMEARITRLEDIIDNMDAEKAKGSHQEFQDKWIMRIICETTPYHIDCGLQKMIREYSPYNREKYQLLCDWYDHHIHLNTEYPFILAILENN
uniref:hypothetical protein n=1 Tax=Lactobacillus acidophilus TaxID=1579 RepID=UPI003F54C196